MRLLLLLVIIGYSFAVSGQQYWSALPRTGKLDNGIRYLWEDYTPQDIEEVKLLGKVDSLQRIFQFTKDNRTHFLEGYWAYDVDFDTAIKKFRQKPLDTRKLIGYWNESIDTLYGWAIAPLYWDTLDAGAGKRSVYSPLYEYSYFLDDDTYMDIRDLFIEKIKGVFNVKEDSTTGVLYTITPIPIDSPSVLPQVNYWLFARKILDAIQVGSADIFTNMDFKTPITREETKMIDDGNDTIAEKLSHIYIVDEWDFDIKLPSSFLPQEKYGYSFAAARKIRAIAFGSYKGPQGFFKFEELLPIAFRRRGEYLAPYEQALLAALFNKYKIHILY